MRPKGGPRHVDVGPQLTLVRIARLEYADHRPVGAAHAHVTCPKPRPELPRHAPADDQLAQSRREITALDDLQLRAQRECLGIDAA